MPSRSRKNVALLAFRKAPTVVAIGHLLDAGFSFYLEPASKTDDAWAIVVNKPDADDVEAILIQAGARKASRMKGSAPASGDLKSTSDET